MFARHRDGPRQRGQQRQQRQDRNDRDVLKEKNGKRGLPAGRAHLALFVQKLEHDRSRRHRQDHADRESDFPAKAERDRRRRDQRRSQHHLRAAEAKNGRAHLPEQRGPQLQPDHEKHHHDAELREVHHVGPFRADEAETKRPDNNSREQIAEDGAEPEPLRQRHGDDGRRKVNECVNEAHVAAAGCCEP